MDSRTQINLIVRIRNPPETEKVKPVFENNNKTTKSANSRLSTTSKSRSKSPGFRSTQTSRQLNSSNTPALKEFAKYSIFTCLEPSNSLICTNKPISGRLINNTYINTQDLYEYSYSLMKEANILEFDHVYNESHKLDQIYNEQIKESISNLFIGKSSSVMFFGPKDGGKSYTLRGGDPSDGGLLSRALQDLFNLNEISKQAYSTKSQKMTAYTIKVSIYQVYNEIISDLMSNQYQKNLKIEKYYDEETGNQSTQIIDLTQKEIRNKKEYDFYLKEAIQYRKLLSQYLKVNEMKRKSHLVISLIVEKKDKTFQSVNRTYERANEKFAQIDFVELASSNYGLNSINIDKHTKEYIPNEDLLYKNVSKTFNSISSNIIAIANGTQSRVESKLSLALKPTLKEGSTIIFFTNVLPTEIPLKNSYKALKFTRWMRNQILNLDENQCYEFNDLCPGSDIELDQIVSLNPKQEYKKRKQNKINEKNYLEDNDTDKVHLSSPVRRNHSNDHNPREKYADKDRYNSRDISRDNERERDKSFHRKSYSKTIEIDSDYQKHSDNNYNTLKSLSSATPDARVKKITELERSIRDIEAKSNEMSRYLENLRADRNNQSKQTITNYNDYETDTLKQENSSLKADIMIYKEDINRLADLNKHLEEELQRQRNRNLELATDNERLNQEKNFMKNEVDRINDSVSKVKIQDNSMMEYYNQRFILETRIRELENENKKINEEKLKYEVDYKVLNERYNELKKSNENLDNEFNYIKNRQAEEVNNIESKLEKMSKEMEYLQRENSQLRLSEERNRQELLSLEKQRDNYRDKYQDYKQKNTITNAKLIEIEDELRKLMLEKQNELFERKREEETKKMKYEAKTKLIDEMQNRISSYKSDIMRQRLNKENI